MAVFLTLISFTSPVLIDASETEQPGPLEENKAVVLQCITLCLEKFDEDFKPFVEKFTVAVWELLLALSQNPKHDRLCVAGMAFLTGVSKTIYHTLLADPTKQTMICEKIIIPNMELRESDMEMFQDDPHEYIQRDIEGSDSDTRRRSACDLIQGLSKNYEQTVTDIFQRYVGFLTQTYTSNPDNWKAKDTAMYLITALTVRGATTQQGTRRINDLVNIGDFFQNHVLPELQDPDPTKVKYPIIKADAIKFVSSFRLQIPKDRYPLLLQLLAQWLRNSNEVVHSYAASAIERLLVVKEPDNQLRLHKDQWKEFVGPLLQHLFQSIQSSQQENEYLMKAVMRVILCGQEHIAPFVPHILPMLTNILTQVARNPKQPTFNHYLFESISGIVRYSPAHLVAVNQALFPLFTQILQSDTPEFMPYVFQILSQLLEGGLEVSQPYIQLFPPLLNPALYENKGNIPPLVRLIRTFLQRASSQIIATNQLNAVMGVFQYLVSSKLYDHEGFNLLNTIVGYVPKESLAGTLKTVFSVLFTRLMNSKTTKYVKCLLVYLSLFTIKISPDALVEAVESLQQPGLYKQVYQNVWLRDVQKVSGKIPRKMCVTALSKILSESQYILSDAVFGELWLPTVVAALKLMELGEEADAEGDKYASKNELTVDQLKQQDQGYMNSYCPLQAASKVDEDPCSEIPDERAYFAQSLQKVVASHGNRCVPALRTLPADIQQRLKPVLPNVL